MPPYVQAFLEIAVRHPGKALAIAWWWVTRRRVRAAGRIQEATAKLPATYRLWHRIHQPNPPPFQPSITTAGDWPSLALHLHIAAGPWPVETLRSVVAQVYPDWTLYLSSAVEQPALATSLQADPRIRILPTRVPSQAAGLIEALEQAQAAYLIPIVPGCTLTPGALLAYAKAIRGTEQPAIFYADQDERDRWGRRATPWLKPEWDEDLFLAQDYLSTACALPVSARTSGHIDRAWADEIAVYALLTRLLLGADTLPARHVPYVAVTTAQDVWRRSSKARVALVHAVTGVATTQGPFGTVMLQRDLPDPAPLVSVIVPTRDRLDLLETCVEGVLHRTDYPAIELIIADNGSVEPATLAYLEQCRRDPRVKVVHWPHPYNYSAINNFAVRHASAPYLCLLNNDTEVIDPSWLRTMMAHAVRPDVGAVGARLLYPDRSIQHAGVVIGMGGAAGHAHRGLPDAAPGWFAQALISRGATAVTAACLVVAKARFDAVGGLDEKGLAIAYNDIDLCLKLRRAGWRNVYAAQAVMVHHESKSRGLDFAPEHLARYMQELRVFQQRWGTVGYADPTHHAALDPASETYRLKL